MTRQELVATLTATPRRQRLALITALAPFYFAFTIGGMTQRPLAMLIGAIGLLVIYLAYRRYAPPLPPRGLNRPTRQAGDQ